MARSTRPSPRPSASPRPRAAARTYGQYCGLARALDIVGDRWTLLIVRELMILGPCRYTDLRNGLPGIATNLLVERVRFLEGAGILERVDAPPPVSTGLWRLTRRGEDLGPALHAIGRWGAKTLEACGPDDAFRSHWMVLPLEMLLRDHRPTRPPVCVEVRAGDTPLSLVTADGGVQARLGGAVQPDAVLVGPPALVMAVLTGKLTLRGAASGGVSLEGTLGALRRIQPAA